MPEIRLSRSCERMIEGTDFTQSVAVPPIKFLRFRFDRTDAWNELKRRARNALPKGLCIRTQ